MDQLFDRVDEVLSGHVEVAETGALWTVKITKSGVSETFEFPTKEAADMYAANEQDRILSK